MLVRTTAPSGIIIPSFDFFIPGLPSIGTDAQGCHHCSAPWICPWKLWWQESISSFGFYMVSLTFWHWLRNKSGWCFPGTTTAYVVPDIKGRLCKEAARTSQGCCVLSRGMYMSGLTQVSSAEQCSFTITDKGLDLGLQVRGPYRMTKLLIHCSVYFMLWAFETN